MVYQEESHRDYVRRMRMRRRQMLKAFAAGGSVGLVSFLAGCSSGAATPTTAPAAPAATKPAAPPTTAAQPTAAAQPTTAPTAAPSPAAATPTAQATPAAQSQAQAGAAPLAGALHLFLQSDTDTIDPGQASFVQEIEVVMRVFSNVYTFDSKANLVEDQADGMPQVSADGKTITVKLKKGLIWSDGSPLKASDFVYGAKRQLNPALAGNYAFTLYALEGGEKYNEADPKKTSADDLKKLRDAVGISAPDDQTIVYKLAGPAPWFLAVLATWNALPVRQDLITKGGAAEENQDWTADPTRYLGNGPYVLTKRDAGSQFVFASNPKYSGGEPPIKSVQYAIIKDITVAFAAYKAGNLDVIGAGASYVNPQIKPAIDADPTLTKQFIKVPGSGTVYIGFNTKRAPFDNVKVRQAFSAALDRDTMANEVFKGLALPANQLLPTGFPGHYDDIPVQKFDPAAAKKLLADAGYTNGQGLPPIKASYAQTDTNNLIMTAYKAMLQQNLNVNVQLDPIEAKAFSALTKKQETTPQLYRLGWLQDYPDPQDWFSTIFESNSTVSHTGWKNDQFDKLCQGADVETDKAKRDGMYKQAAAILNQDSPAAFIYYYVAAYLIKPTVQGYKADPFEYFFGQHSLSTMKLTS